MLIACYVKRTIHNKNNNIKKTIIMILLLLIIAILITRIRMIMITMATIFSVWGTRDIHFNPQSFTIYLRYTLVFM